MELSIFLWSSTRGELRAAHFDELIKSYYYSLCATIKLLGSDPERLFTFDQLKLQLKKIGKLGLILAIPTLESTSVDTQCGINIVNISENIQSDSNVEIVSKYTNEAIMAYKERIGDIVRDGLRYEWI